jgi:hypothetical protein
MENGSLLSLSESFLPHNLQGESPEIPDLLYFNELKYFVRSKFALKKVALVIQISILYMAGSQLFLFLHPFSLFLYFFISIDPSS